MFFVERKIRNRERKEGEKKGERGGVTRVRPRWGSIFLFPVGGKGLRGWF